KRMQRQRCAREHLVRCSTNRHSRKRTKKQHSLGEGPASVVKWTGNFGRRRRKMPVLFVGPGRRRIIRRNLGILSLERGLTGDVRNLAAGNSEVCQLAVGQTAQLV